MPRSEEIDRNPVPAGSLRLWIAIAISIPLAHAGGVLLLFSPADGLWNGQPLIEQDYGLHYHHILSAASLWADQRRLWGYNPFFMAGYPSNTIQDASIKLFELISIVAPDPIVAFKILVFLSAAFSPACVFAGALLLFSNLKTATLALLLATFAWWNSLPREMLFYGMVGFPAASCFAFAVVGIFWRALQADVTKLSRGVSACIALGIALGVLIGLHIQSVVIVLPPMIVAFVAMRARVTPRVMLLLTGAALIPLAMNQSWFFTFLAHRRDDVSASLVREVGFFVSTDPLCFLKDYLGQDGFFTFRTTFAEKVLRIALFVLGLSGIVNLWRTGNRPLGALLMGCVAPLFLLAYFGSLIEPLRAWQPLRFKVPLDLALALGAASFLASFRFSPRPPAGALLALGGCAIGIAGFLWNVWVFESAGAFRLRRGIPPEMQRIIDWARDEVPTGGRILFEESGDESGFVYEGMYLSNFVAHLAGREMIGGPSNFYNDSRRFTHFFSGRFLGRPIRSFSEKELESYFDLYDITAIVAFDPESLARFGSMPGLIKLDRRIGPIALMRIERPSSRFYKGAGTMRAGLNALRCEEVQGDEVILKYHWLEGMRSNPLTDIEPIRLLDDPTPFIRIKKPPRSFAIGLGSAPR